MASEAPVRLLMLDDSAADALLAQTALDAYAPGGFDLTVVACIAEALRRVAEGRFDVVVSDLGPAGSDQLETVRRLVSDAPALPLVVLTASGDEVLARAAIQAGAQDFLVKGASSGELIARTLRHAIERKRLELQLREANESLERRVAERTAELERANATLCASEARYRALTQSAHDAIVTIDAAGHVIGWNRGAERLFGHAEFEIAGEPLLRLIPERHHARHAAALQRLTATGDTPLHRRSIELHGLHRDGHEFPLELSLALWQVDGVRFVTGIMRDASERRQAQALLRLQGAALDAAANGIVITDRHGRIRWCNTAFTQLTGYAADEAAGQRPGDLLRSGLHDEAFYRAMWATITEGRVWRGEIVNRRRDGSLYTEQMTITPVRDDSGAIANFIAIKHDISDRMEVAQRLAESERRSRTLIGNLQGMVFRCSSESGWPVEFASDGVRALLGIEPDDLMSGRIRYGDLIHPGDRGEVLLAARRQIVQRRRYDQRYRVRHADGRWIWVRSLAVGVFGDGGALVGIEGYTLDITDRQQALERLAASERFARTTLDALSAHIAILDEHGTIVATNRAWDRFAAENGADPQRVGVGASYIGACSGPAGGPALVASDGDGGVDVERAIAALVAGGSDGLGFEYPCHAPSAQRWFYCRISRFAADGPVRVVVSHEDITPMRRAQEALRASDERFRHTFERAAVGIAHIGRDGRFMHCNPHLAAIVGRRPDELVGTTFHELTHPDDLPKGLSLLDRLLAGEIPTYTIEKRYRHRSGDSVWVHVSASTVRDADGAIDYVVQVVENIHQRKLTHLALQALNTDSNGQAFLQQATQALASLLGIEIAFVAESSAADPLKVRLRALCADGGVVADGEGDLRGTPLHDVFERDAELLTHDAGPGGATFDLLTATGVHSCAAVPLWSNTRAPLGLLGVMSRQPLHDLEALRTLLRLMALRVAGELEWEREDRKFRELLDGAPTAVFLVDMVGRIRLASRAGERLFGWAPQSLVGRTIGCLVPEEQRSAYRARMRRCVEGATAGRQPADRFEAVALRHDGSRFDAEVQLGLLDTADGRAVVVHVQDITRLKRAADLQQQLNQQLEARVQARTLELQQAHHALGEKELEIRSVVEHMSDCVITADHDGTIRSVNPVVERIFGWRPDELVGRNIALLLPPDDRDRHDGHLTRHHRAGPSAASAGERQVVGMHRDGTRIPLDLSISSYRIGDRHCLTGVLRDIRERVRIMRELDQARHAAEQSSRAKSAFLASMSHEIRTPMNGVIGMIDVLQQTGLRDNQIEIVATARESADALLRIVDDVLDFSKIEAGQMTVEAEPFDLAAVVESACDTLDYVAGQKSVELTLYTDPALPARVLGDPVRLRQVLLNLAGNAIKFSSGPGRHGRVAVRVTPRQLDDGRVEVAFAVTDNGIGMGPETLANLFSPFSQADASTTRRFGGTGLGLSISHRLVTMMQGAIAVQSEVGRGSGFTVTLAFEVVPDALPPPPPRLAGVRCAVVAAPDGEGMDLCGYLRHAGAQVATAADAGAACDWIAAQPPGRCVVVDSDAGLPLDALRAAAAPGVEARFVRIGRGRRRRPRVDAADLVGVDGEVLHRTTFVDAVAMAAGLDAAAPSVPPPASTPSRPVPERVSPSAGAPAILIAEDNEINRRVVLQQLALLGLGADIVANGAEALALWRCGRYGLLFTDLHMPVMDGYELARAIRAAEGPQQHLPIVALTANAVSGEAERCRQVGMDDYVTKPVPLSTLKATIDRWLPRITSAALPGAAAAPDAARPAAAVDAGVLKSLVGDDPALIAELMREFRVNLADGKVQMRAAAASGDAAPVVRLAHRLKSSARSVGALPLGETCASIEQQARDRGLADIGALLRRFDAEVALVEHELSTW